MGISRSFNQWIDSIGIPKLALILNVDPATVRHWKHGRATPRPHQLKRIKRISKGVIGYDQILDGAPALSPRATRNAAHR